MTVEEARRVAAEYGEARIEMRAAVARFEAARRAFDALPFWFEAAS